MSIKNSAGRAVKIILLIIALLLAVISVNTLGNTSKQLDVPTAENLALDDSKLSELLSKAIQYRTISSRDSSKVDFTQFEAFLSFLRESFPLLHQQLSVEYINKFGILVTWDSGNSERPALFLAHYDVVPVENVADWQNPPFAGVIKDDHIWGRGALDDKSAIISQMFAVETLLSQNYTPPRTLLFAYGHDEEVGGEQGAKKLAETLANRGLNPIASFDEGMPITQGILKGIKQPAALIAIAEKGYLTLDLRVETAGGHSSSPPPHSAVGILAKAITQIENHPMPAQITGPVGRMFDTLSPEMAFAQKAVLSNRWLFESVLAKQLSGKNSTNALIRTTAAATMFEGSQQANVLPPIATAAVNFRLIPGNNVEQVIDHVNAVINDSRVKVSINGTASEPSSVSANDSVAFNAIAKSVRETMPETLVAPALMIAITDSRHYSNLVDDAYRFRPLWITQEDVKRFHGKDERISIANLNKMTQYHISLFKNIGS